MIKQWFFYFWLKNIKTSFLLIALIVSSWIFSIISIPKESSPEIKFWIININVSYPWVNPVDIDNLITDEIEKEIENLEGIKNITSTSSIWSSSITVELDTWVNTRNLLTDIKDKVDSINFPEEAEDPIVSDVSSNSTLLYEALIYWDADAFDDFSLMQKAKSLVTKLDDTSWISSIDIWWLDDTLWSTSWWWSSDYDIKVLLSKSKVELLWLSITDISNKIKWYNKDFPIWNYRVWDLSYDFRFEWELSSLNDLKNVVISDNGTSKIKLSDIAEFKLEYDINTIKRLWFYWVSWQNYISLVFNKAEDSNVFKSSGSSKKVLENILKNDIEFEWLSVKYSKDMGETIIEDYESLWKTALTTIVLVFITILFFVGFREGIIASILVPLAFLITFIVLDYMGSTMNFLTNFSLVLTLWIAIDTVIVIVEWASERMKLGFSKESSIMLAIRDFRSPLISWTSTTLVAFLPMIFLPWIIGKFLSFIPITVFITLIAALFLSLSIASALFVTLQKPSKTFHREEKVEKNMREDDLKILQKDREFKIAKDEQSLSIREKILQGLWKIYEKTLNKVFSRLIYKLSFIFIPIIVLVLSLVTLSPKIGFILFPQTDEWVMNIDIKWKTGVSKDFMEQYIEDIDNILSNIPEIRVYYTTVEDNTISVYIDLFKKAQREKQWLLSAYSLETKLDEQFSYLRSNWLDLSVAAQKGWPPTGSAVWIKLVAENASDFDSLKKVSEDFELFLKGIAWTKNVNSSSSDTPWQFVFEFDKQKLSSLWLTQSDILNEIYFYTNWIKSWSIKQGSQDNEIVVSFKEFEDFLNPEDVLNLVVSTRAWKVRLGDFVEFDFKKSVSSIWRIDWKVVISIWSEVKEWVLPTEIQPKLEEFAESYSYPQNISFMKSWESEENKDLIVSTFKSLLIAMFLIFSILVFQFNSFIQPLIVLYSIVLALLGVNIWLYATWNPYSMPFAIWFIALTWVVVNDAIILIDRINKQIQNKLKNSKTSDINYLEQIIIAWKSRLQPIIVTTVTTIFGVLPLALQDEFWAGLGFTIIFWLFVWSFMTLVVIPILYQILVLGRKKKKKTHVS